MLNATVKPMSDEHNSVENHSSKMENKICL